MLATVMIEHPYQQLQSPTLYPSHRSSSASTIVSSEWSSTIQNKHLSPDVYSTLHHNLTHPPDSQHKTPNATAHWSDYYINPPYYPPTRQHPLDNSCRTSTSAEAIALHSGLQKQGYSIDQGLADTIDYYYPLASFASAVWASCSQEQISSAKPSPLDFLPTTPSSPKANRSTWNPTKRVRTAPGIRELRYHAQEEGFYTGRFLTGKPSPHTFRAKRLLRSQSLDRAGDTYCSSTTPVDLVVQLPSHPLALKEDPFIHNTDPHKTASAWEDVRKMSYKSGSNPSYTQQTISSSSKHQPGYTARSVSSTKSNSKKKAPSPYDSGFGRRVLTPRNITMAEMETSMVQANLHFKTEKPSGIRRDYYIQKRQAVNTSIWLEADEKFVTDVVREYRCMQAEDMNEAEFATWGKTHLFKNEPRALTMTEQRCWKPERMLELVAKPSEKKIDNNWHPPPLVGDLSPGTDTAWHDYAFDLRADCCYWLSLQAFNPAYMTQVGNHAHVIKKRITLPYMTIEFKKDDFDDVVAENQVAAASSVALYNRFRLKEKALRVSGMEWTLQKLNLIQHYCITMKGSTYAIWLGTPTVTREFRWDGCKLNHIFKGDLTTIEGVRDLVDWVNEIHCWALTVYGPRAEHDIKVCINPKESGFRVSDIAMALQAEQPDDSILGKATDHL